VGRVKIAIIGPEDAGSLKTLARVRDAAAGFDPLPLLLIGSYRAGQRRHLQTFDSYIAI